MIVLNSDDNPEDEILVCTGTKTLPFSVDFADPVDAIGAYPTGFTIADVMFRRYKS